MTKIFLIAFASLTVLTACDDSDARIAVVCTDYCNTQAQCDSDVNEDSCYNDCTASLGDCQADEVAATLDELSSCADETCDDQGMCALEADAQCYFGI